MMLRTATLNVLRHSPFRLSTASSFSSSSFTRPPFSSSTIRPSIPLFSSPSRLYSSDKISSSFSSSSPSSFFIHRPSSSSPPLASSFHLDHSFSSNPFFDRHTKTPSIWPLIYAGIVIGVFVVYITAHLETIPFSSRFHLIFLSPAAENSFGEEFFEKEIARKKLLENDNELTEFIKEIAGKLCFVAEDMWREGADDKKKMNNESPFQWRIVIVDSPAINAVCYPGGKLVVYRGLIDFMIQSIHNELKHEEQQKGINEKDMSNTAHNLNALNNNNNDNNNNNNNNDEVSTALQSIRFHIEGWFANAQMLYNAVVYNNPHASTEQITIGAGGEEEEEDDEVSPSPSHSSSSHFYESPRINLPAPTSAAYDRLENELAFVLAHEIGHTLARHVAEKISFFSPFSMITSLLFPSSPLLNYLFQYFIELPYSRSHETEADKIGLMLVARSDYDPYASLRVLRRRQENSTPSLLHYVSTHPADERRAKKCEGWMTMAHQQKKDYAEEMTAHYKSFRQYLLQKGKENIRNEEPKKKRFYFF